MLLGRLLACIDLGHTLSVNEISDSSMDIKHKRCEPDSQNYVAILDNLKGGWNLQCRGHGIMQPY